MNLTDIRTIAAKDLWVALHRRATVITLLLFPLLAALGLNAVLRFSGQRSGGIPAGRLPSLLDAFLFFFVIGAATLPTGIAAYSLVGEKVERSLEPLLATPARDTDILLAKSLAALLPPITASWLGAVLFMVLADAQTHTKLGHAYFPNTSATLVVLLVMPLAAALAVMINVLVSSRTVDVRTAQQIGALPALPFAALYVLSEVGAITLTTTATLLVCAGLAVLVVAMFFAGRAIFNREEILTRWR